MGVKGAGEVNEGEIVLCERFPADAECSEVVVPAVRPLNDPATRTTDSAAAPLLTASTKMQADAAASDLARRIVVVVALIEAEVHGSTRAARRSEGDGIERLSRNPLVVDVGAGQDDGDWDSASVGEDVSLRAKLSTIGRIGTGEAPPLGAFTEALSREHQVQSIPRSSS